MEGDFLVIASCQDNPMKKDEHYQSAGIMSRKTEKPSDAIIQKTEEMLKSYGIATTFTETLHENCQY